MVTKIGTMDMQTKFFVPLRLQNHRGEGGGQTCIKRSSGGELPVSKQSISKPIGTELKNNCTGHQLSCASCKKPWQQYCKLMEIGNI